MPPTHPMHLLIETNMGILRKETSTNEMKIQNNMPNTCRANNQQTG